MKISTLHTSEFWRGVAASSVLSISLASSQLLALDYDAEVLLRTGNESNASLAVSDEEESEQVSRAGLILSLANIRDWYEFESSYAFFREEYGDDQLSDQSVTVGNTKIDINLVEDRLSFFASHRAEQQRASVVSLDTSDEEETINSLEGGLNFRLPLGKKADLNLNARTEDIQIDASETTPSTQPDSQAHSGGATLSYYPTRSNIFSAGVQQVESQRDGSDIDQKSTLTFIGYSRVARALRYNIQVGQSRFTFGNSKDEGLFVSGGASYKSDSQFLELSVDRQNANTATGILSTDGDLDTILDSGFQVDNDSLIDSNSNSAIEVTQTTLDYGNRICPRCDLNLSFSYIATDFEATEGASDFTSDDEQLEITDREESLASLTFDYRLSRSLSTIFDYEWRGTSFQRSNDDFDEDIFALTLQWDVNNRLRLLADATREERRSDDGITRRNNTFSVAINYLLLTNSPDQGRRTTRFDF